MPNPDSHRKLGEAFYEISLKFLQSDDDALFRTAISRAYFGLYHIAIFVAKKLEPKVSQYCTLNLTNLSEDHANLRKFLECAGKNLPHERLTHLRHLATLLFDLREARNEADYNPETVAELILSTQSGRGIGIRDEISTFAITKSALLKELI